MEIYNVNSEKARLANVRVRIEKAYGHRPPWSDMDIIFNPYASSVNDEPLYDPEGTLAVAEHLVTGCNGDSLMFYATEERIKELCGDDPKFLTPEGLAQIWKEDGSLIKCWMDGHVYWIVLEKWDAGKREFVRIDDEYALYGRDETESLIIEMLNSNFTAKEQAGIVVCVDTNECDEFTDVKND